jgi:hypothetical protein
MSGRKMTGQMEFHSEKYLCKDQYASGARLTSLRWSFIDTDPDMEMAFHCKYRTPGITGDTTINLNSLSQGIHVLYGRIKNAIGKWSFLQKRSFLFESEYIEVAQFRFDSLPGYENWVPSDTFTPYTDIIAEVDFEGICDLDTAHTTSMHGRRV